MCIMLAFASIALIFSSSLLPFCSVLLIFIYQISLEHAPSMPSFSDHYFTGARFVLLLVFSVMLLLALGYFLIFKLCIGWRDIRKLPNLKSALLLSSAFLLNGIFSGEWMLASALFGALQVLSFFVIGYIFILGAKNVTKNELFDYFTVLCAMIAMVLLIETACLYLFRGVITDGAASKGAVLYGWGIWTTAGMDMAVLIPVLFLGALRSKHSVFYLILAHMTYLSAVLTLSRNALVFATLALIISAAFYVKYAKNAKVLVKIYLLGAFLLILMLPLYFDGILRLFSDLLERGFSDNGRFELWKYGLLCFSEAPIFGKGFFALKTDTFRAENFFPPMLHNTPIQLLASMGLFGFFAYVIYRIKMLRGLKKAIDRNGIFLLISISTLLLMSLFDNFLFHIQPMFLFSFEYAALAAYFCISSLDMHIHI